MQDSIYHMILQRSVELIEKHLPVFNYIRSYGAFVFLLILEHCY